MCVVFSPCGQNHTDCRPLPFYNTMSSALLEERRLRPVYQELENGRPKSALAELTKYIKKTSARADSPSVCALKCLVHQRLGQVEEAYDVFLRMATEGNGKSGGAGQAKIGSSASTSTSTSTSKPKVIKGKKGAKIKGGKPPQVKPQPQAQVHEEGEAPESSKQEELQAKDAVESTQSNAGKDEDKVAEKKLTERKWKDLGEDVLHTLGYALRPMRKCKQLPSLSLQCDLLHHTFSFVSFIRPLSLHSVQFFHLGSHLLLFNRCRLASMLRSRLVSPPGERRPRCPGFHVQPPNASFPGKPDSRSEAVATHLGSQDGEMGCDVWLLADRCQQSRGG